MGARLDNQHLKAEQKFYLSCEGGIKMESRKHLTVPTLCE